MVYRGIIRVRFCQSKYSCGFEDYFAKVQQLCTKQRMQIITNTCNIIAKLKGSKQSKPDPVAPKALNWCNELPMVCEPSSDA